MERRGGSNDLQGWQEQLGGRAQRAITQNRPNEKCFSHLHERSRVGGMSTSAEESVLLTTGEMLEPCYLPK